MVTAKTIPFMMLSLCVVVLVACEKEAVEATEIVRPVRILTMSTLQGGESLSYPGEIQGVQHAELAFEVAGRLINLSGRAIFRS